MLESQNHLGRKRTLRSLSPTINLALPSTLLNHFSFLCSGPSHKRRQLGSLLLGNLAIPSHVLFHVPVRDLLENFPHNLPRGWVQANMSTVSPILLLGDGNGIYLFLLPRNLSHDHSTLMMSEKQNNDIDKPSQHPWMYIWSHRLHLFNSLKKSPTIPLLVQKHFALNMNSKSPSYWELTNKT